MIVMMTDSQYADQLAVRTVASICDVTGRNGWSRVRIKEVQGVIRAAIETAIRQSRVTP